ncbi:SusC/RagA family TonB-linked outer membrane protein [Sphingobacterium athyrii]|uniref:SusC/RagA family TonB-linked outer membrane protein n=2 Tax=Sphingobacterium athyrii TaxID=2152717 RepID=A0A363NVA7_9SPHI|nr:SusC/RagA family TonB-linked outer membrane protein [Sphingobacterium athyrii]
MKGCSGYFIGCRSLSRVMTILLTSSFVHVYGHAYSQKLTLNMKNASLKSVLSQIQKQTNYDFLIGQKQLDRISSINLVFKNADINHVLHKCLGPYDLVYEIKDKTIFIRESSTTNSYPSTGARQKKELKGIVTDSLGNVLPGVTVKVQGTNKATSTDQNGNFLLENIELNQILEISLLGFDALEWKVQTYDLQQIILQSQVKGLDEVVVVGYGTQLKRDLTGAVDQISGKELRNMPVRNATEALQGQAAGVQITSTGGSPGTPPAVRIRGIGTVNDNNPLYVVDGLPQSDIGWLNPNDIQSMEVLKDASATAIYGSRAANGVIMVTTQKGSQGGDKLSNLIGFDTYFGFQNPVKVYDMMNATQFMDYKNLANTNAGLAPYFTESNKQEVLKFLRSNNGDEEGTNWWKEVNQKNALIQNYDISIAGGMKDLSYRTSLNYLNQEGIIKGSDYDRISFRTNIEHNLRSWLKLSVNIGIVSEGRGNVLENSPGFNTAFIAFVADPISPVYRNNLKDIPGFLKDALFLDKIDINNPWSFYSPILMTNKENPVAQTAIYEKNRWKGKAIKGGGSIDVKLTDWLKFRSNLGLDLANGGSNSFAPKYYLNGNQFNSDATVGAYNSKTDYYVWENTFSFEKKWNDHHFTALVGTSAEQWSFESSGASKQGFVSNAPSQWIIDAGTINPQASGTKWESALNSYFGRVFYSYKNRYMFTGNFRYDGSSNFGTDKKWGAFPSLSVGWNFADEDFVSEITWLSKGKLRASWGNIGNQNIGRGAYLTTYSGNQGYYYFGNYVPQLSGGSNYFGNSNIQWEKTEQLDVGLDLSFLQNKLEFNIDYYKKDTEGMLLTVPLPNYLGYSNSPWTNAGSVRNKGVEFAVKYHDKIGAFGYSIGANASTFKNRVLSLGGGEPIPGGGWISYTTTLTEENMPIGYYYGFKTNGIFQNQAEIDQSGQTGAVPGDLRFVDVNKDGIISSSDRTYIGDPFPDLSYGFTLGADYKNFDLKVLAQGTIGNDIMNIVKIDMKSGVGWYNAPKELLNDAWSPTNPSQSQFKISSSNQNNLQISDWLVEDGSYLRIKSIQLGYSLPSPTLERLQLKGLRVWAGAYNLFTFTKYSGLDPEIGNSSPLNMGVDQGYYPVAKSWMLGLNLSF